MGHTTEPQSGRALDGAHNNFPDFVVNTRIAQTARGQTEHGKTNHGGEQIVGPRLRQHHRYRPDLGTCSYSTTEPLTTSRLGGS